MSDSLQPHGLQHARLLHPSPTPRAYSNSGPSSWWCHPTVSSSIVTFSSCLQYFPASGSSSESVLRIKWPKYWSFSFSISPSNEYSGLISFKIDCFDLLAVQGTQESSPTPQFKSINSLALSFICGPTLTSMHDHWKNHSFTRQTFVGKVMSLLFNMLSRLAITCLPRIKCLLISWLQSPSAVILEPKKIKSVTVSIVSLSICLEVMGQDAMILVFWILSFKSLFQSHLSLSPRGSLVLLLILSKVWCHLYIWGYWYFSQQSWFQAVVHQASISHDVLCI